MKKVIGVICILFCLSFFFFRFEVQASEEESVKSEDGTLKINTDIQTTPQPSGIRYIEQESDLSALFRLETTVNIQQQKDKRKKEELQDKNNLFIKEHPAERLVEIYTAELFHANVAVTRLDNQQITLNAVPSSFSMTMILVLLIAGIMMGYSVIRVLIKKKGQDK